MSIQNAAVPPSPLRGFLAGAALGALFRFLVGIGFVFYLIHWGNLFKDMNEDGYWFALVSAAIGSVIGGSAAATCRPITGALIGGVLSACSCIGLVFLPWGVAASALARENYPFRAVLMELTGGLVAMTIVGALAGGIGARIGAKGFTAPETSPY